MSTDNIVSLPNWKKNATAYERLSELAILAKEYPSRFNKFVIVYEELRPNGNIKLRNMSFKGKEECLGLAEELGLLNMGQLRLWEASSK